MAILKHLSDGKEYQLIANTLIGRGRRCDVVIDNQMVSNHHADISWNGETWDVHDLGSLNGSFVDGRNLAQSARTPLKKGAKLSFGDADDVYELIDDSPPLALAFNSQSGDEQTEANGMLCIPSVDLPLCTISYREGRWIAEPSDAEIHTVRSGDSVVVDGERWKLELPTIVEGTIAPDSDEINLRLVHAEFRHSRDQEHVVIYIHHGKQTIEIDARAHSYMLLLLAKARVRDRQQGESRSEEGWISVDALLEQLIDHDDNRLNVAIYRARKQLSEAGISNATELIERRPLAREVRIGFRNITIASL
ncbi:MAG: FHA domain-containing protein [Haliangiales bacterium]